MATEFETAGLEGERRQVTVLFADLVGFTGFSERSGEEAAFALMRRLAGMMTAVVEEQGGSVRNFTGDGIMALFGVPTALEDGPLGACRTSPMHGLNPKIEPKADIASGKLGKM